MSAAWRDEEGARGERYEYDAVGHLKKVQYDAQQPWDPHPIGATRTVDYTLEALNRQAATTYDQHGTQVSREGYSRSSLNQYTAVTGQSLGYDGNFNVSYLNGGEGHYDAEKRLRKVTAGGGSVLLAEFVYDGMGRCVKRVLNGEPARLFTYDGWKPLLEWDASHHGLLAWNTYGAGADEILARWDALHGGYQIPKLDRLGNVVALLNGAGAVLERYKYDAFGQPTVTNGDGVSNPRDRSWHGNRFLFTGREWIASLNLYDYRHRMYRPSLGRFLQPDPIGFKAGDMNLFRYCGGDPVNRVDPMGLDYGPFSDPDQAFRFFHQKFNNRSIQENREYRAETYKLNSRYYITDAKPGDRDNSRYVPILTKNAKHVAINHAHGAWSVGYIDRDTKKAVVVGRASKPANDSFNSGKPSPTDVEIGKRFAVYTSTPAGTGYRQRPGDSTYQEVKTGGQKNDPAVESYKPLTAAEIDERERQAEKSGRLFSETGIMGHLPPPVERN